MTGLLGGRVGWLVGLAGRLIKEFLVFLVSIHSKCLSIGSRDSLSEQSAPVSAGLSLRYRIGAMCIHRQTRKQAEMTGNLNPPNP